MTRLLLLGAGKIGAAITDMLSSAGDYAVTVADADPTMLDVLTPGDYETRRLDATDAAALRGALDGFDMVVSALPFYLNVAVAEAARGAGVHYFDLTEDVETTRAIRAIADGAATAFMPQCGLAPGFVSVAAHDLALRFDQVRDISMRVGALPQFPVNELKYNLTWSTDGLINEYCNPCEAIHGGRRIELLALEGLEHFSLDGVRYEAFNTSGGLGTMCDTWAGKVDTLNYKTVRYPGHRQLVHMLVHDLRLSDRRALFRDLLETAVPMTKQDVVLVFVTVAGTRAARLTQESFARKVYNGTVNGHDWSAIQITTAAGLCTMVDLMREGALPGAGFVRQEDASLAAFMANRFGRFYATPRAG